MTFVRAETRADVTDLGPDTKIRVNGTEKTMADYVNLTVAGTPLLVVLMTFGHTVEVDR